MTVTFPSYDAFKYTAVYEIIEKKGGCVYKTKLIGYCETEKRVKKENEIYASLSMKLLKQETITLELLPNDD